MNFTGVGGVKGSLKEMKRKFVGDLLNGTDIFCEENREEFMDFIQVSSV
jgi:hypothetical protein